MPIFAILCKDKPGSLPTRLANRPAHLDYLNGSDVVKIAGALMGEDGNPVGSLFLIEAEDLAAAQAQAAGDPFTSAGVFDSVEVHPLRIAVGTVA
jgi:uncharacterized protein YciI